MLLLLASLHFLTLRKFVTANVVIVAKLSMQMSVSGLFNVLGIDLVLVVFYAVPTCHLVCIQSLQTDVLFATFLALIVFTDQLAMDRVVEKSTLDTKHFVNKVLYTFIKVFSCTCIKLVPYNFAFNIHSVLTFTCCWCGDGDDGGGGGRRCIN